MGALSAMGALSVMAGPGASAGDAGTWQYYGGDQGGRHFSTAAQINRDSVAQLDVLLST